MSLVLGIASSHDASACVFRDGKLVSAISEERLSRLKCDGNRMPQDAIDAVLAEAGATRRDVTHIALLHASYPEHYFKRHSAVKEAERMLSRAVRKLKGKEQRQVWVDNLLKILAANNESIDGYFRRDVFLQEERFSPNTVVKFYDHHETHAVLAAFYSGFDSAAVITIDGVGDLNIHHTSSIYRDGTLTRKYVSTAPDPRDHQSGTSAGMVYFHITQLLGFMPLRHEGKVLGLAAYGDPTALAAGFDRALRLAPSGHTFDSDFANVPSPEDAKSAYLKTLIDGHSRENVAAATQAVFERTIVGLIRNFLVETGLRNVAANGGAFANVKLNQRIAALPEVDSLYVYPAMSDTGNSVGAALLMLDQIEPGFVGRNAHRMVDVYDGPAPQSADIRAEATRLGLKFEEVDEATLVARAAERMHAGQVVGWFQGRMEFGPRALGNRSMVAAPTDRSINKWLNERLERTEFMPFAPSVLAEYADDIFDNVAKSRHTAEFMTITYDVKASWRARIPAVVHVDSTARPQLVRKDRNPRYWLLIDRYRQLSGIPLVLNTSFNVHEEPIVCLPKEGLKALADRRVDCLAIGDFWVERAT